MKYKVFIDGRAGTTGLRIYDRLLKRDDVELLTLSDEERKLTEKRREMLNGCDIAFLCLPDDAAREAVSLIDDPAVVVLDTSTAHRTLDDWTYGFPELSRDRFAAVAASKRIAVPGCHASGFIALVKPLVDAGIIPVDLPLACHSLTGYSGGGKKMIAEYESTDRPARCNAPAQYALTQQHKHLREMVKITGIAAAPVFCPIVADFYSGMMVTVPLARRQLAPGATPEAIRDVYRELYRGPIVSYVENSADGGMISANALSCRDTMHVTVEGNDDRILLIAVYDNLGKGASGAAVECMNIVMNKAPETGLEL